MKTRDWLVAAAVASGLATLGGCCTGMKVTFTNYTQRAVDAEFLTQGGPEHQAHTRLGMIEPGKSKGDCKKFDEELLPANFSITLDGGTADTLTEIVEIPRKYPRKLQVDIRPDEDLGRVIEVYDGKGNLLPKK